MTEHDDSKYFSSYEDIDIHELMLKDKPRTEAYRKFIEENGELFEGKVVMDVGSGTGILSLFAAKAGAKQVYAVEASEVSHMCEAISIHNGYEEKITVIHNRVEDVVLPEGLKIDVIISEWMGFYLLHESMLSSIIYARDKWLTPGGVMLPSTASLYLCPVSMKDYHREHIQYWSNVYGFDFFPIMGAVKAKLLSQPKVVPVEPSGCLAEPELVTHIDMQFVAAEDIMRIPGNFAFKICKPGILHGFACWFDVTFEGAKPTVLATDPGSPATHWKQTVLFMPDSLLVNRDEEVVCSLELKQHPQNPRRYDITIEICDDTVDSDDAEVQTDEVQKMLLQAMAKPQ